MSHRKSNHKYYMNLCLFLDFYENAFLMTFEKKIFKKRVNIDECRSARMYVLYFIFKITEMQNKPFRILRQRMHYRFAIVLKKKIIES